MDEDDLRQALERMADRAPSAAAVAQSAQRKQAVRAGRARMLRPLLAVAAVLAVIGGAAAAVLSAQPSSHSSAVPPPVSATSTQARPSQPAVSVATPPPITSDLQACRTHLPTALLAQRTTVAGVIEVGPRPLGGWNAHLGKFGATSPVTLCLVPGSTGFDAVAVTPDGKTYRQWTQSDGTMFMFPM